MPDPVAADVAEERWHRFMELQAQISREQLANKVGREIQVLVDAVDENGVAIARSSADAPEIDGSVIIEEAAQLAVGEMYQVSVNDSDDYDLFATVTES